MYGHVVGEMAAVTETVCNIDCDRLIDTVAVVQGDVFLKLQVSHSCEKFTAESKGNKLLTV